MTNMKNFLTIAHHSADIPPNFLVNPADYLTGAANFLNDASGYFIDAPRYLIAASNSFSDVSYYLTAASNSFSGVSYYLTAAFDFFVTVHANLSVCSLSLMVEASSQTACTDFGDVCHDFGTP